MEPQEPSDGFIAQCLARPCDFRAMSRYMRHARHRSAVLEVQRTMSGERVLSAS